MATKGSDLQRVLCKPVVKYVVAFLIPVLMLLLIFNRLELYPYEKLTVLTSDLNGQYVSYFGYIREMLKNGNGLFYTFSKTLGGDMMGLAGYYTMSPLNILLFLFPLDEITLALGLITVLKVGLSGLTMYIYICSKRACIYKSMLFSTTYALMGFTITFLMNLMWLDSVIMLPLVILGIEKIYKSKPSLTYIITLAVTIISCYYTGYMVCIFAFLYAVYMFAVSNSKIRVRVKSFIRFGFSSICAAGISAAILIPSILALQGSKDTGIETKLEITTKFRITELLSKFFSGAYTEEQIFLGLPNVYCGMLIVVLVILFFMNKHISLKEKVVSAAMLIVLGASMYITQLDTIWHGLATPNGFNYRYTFVLIFFLIVIAEKGFHVARGMASKIKIVATAVILFTIAVLILYMKYVYIKVEYIVFDLAIIIAMLYLIYNYVRIDKVLKPLFIFALFALQCICLYTNSYICLSINEYADRSIGGFVREVKPVVDYIEKNDDGFYRLEKDFYYSNNDAMLLSYNGLSHFSSTEKDYVKNFMKQLGYTRGYTYWVYYNNGSTTAADSLLGVKYILTREDALNIYDQIYKSETIKAFENPYAFPLGWQSNRGIEQVVENDDLFIYQNDIYTSVTGNNKSIFEPVTDYECHLENVTEYVENDHYFYTKSNNDADGDIRYAIKANSTDPVYMYLPATQLEIVEMYVNGELIGDYFDVYKHDIVCLGEYDPGNIINVTLRLKGNQTNYKKPQIYTQNMEVLEKHIELIQGNSYEITKNTSSYIEGNVNVESDDKYIMLSIPYDENWDIKVDGNQVEQVEVLDSLTAIPVSKGNHSIILKYVSPGFELGLIITSISVVIFLIYCIIYVLVIRNKSKKVGNNIGR